MVDAAISYTGILRIIPVALAPSLGSIVMRINLLWNAEVVGQRDRGAQAMVDLLASWLSQAHSVSAEDHYASPRNKHE